MITLCNHEVKTLYRRSFIRDSYYAIKLFGFNLDFISII